MTEWIATRAAGERILAAFTPRMGRRNANGRNADHGPGAHKAVSMLSPYIRRRLVLESEAVAAALAGHGLEHGEKFVEEVVWRGYFKGWLERRPQVWDGYCTGLEADLAAVDRDRRLRRDLLAPRLKERRFARRYGDRFHSCHAAVPYALPRLTPAKTERKPPCAMT